MVVVSCGGDGDDGRRGGRSARSRSLDSPDIVIREAANVDQARRPSGRGTRDHGHNAVLTHKRKPCGLGFTWSFASNIESPKTCEKTFGKQYLLTVGHPRGLVRVEYGRREP